ncbi:MULTISPECIES: TatD family hydrolase [Cupriavidus]|jgi:TatD DNase family protein|uniref:Mg-dependent DNase (TatD family) n=2 Tax=Cupriavidus metallidurans TaxID=119219 RepID=Q1LPJ8_CUPMC|nr:MULTISPECIES: TatD family hydrolase [Cupriavidus]ABF07928.1 Mg-dependent DNase (TatD family) [Cupriavidus metallidurans CH34]KWR82782.1 DNAase [Cupriavidus sp. SHE]KWW36736.1 putative deoxyribonuclease YjjV [Cupriavidus metallidurans]QBP09221.1 TatD family deoxyribonuclease [Cupriavidus metallidurans]QGS27782.1 TatD family deoxyribonuclease [Cupriavidus metallidurans]
MWIDTHCHLDASEFDADRADVTDAAAAAGVTGIVLPAVAVANFDVVRGLAHTDPRCVYALGIHPLYSRAAGQADLDELRRQVTASIDDPRLVAIGEIGLDFFVPGLDAAHQTWLYAEQLKIARDFDLPVLLHVRKSQDQILAQLRRAGVRQGIAHAFNGSHDQAHHYVTHGMKLGFGGNVTFSRARQIRRLAAELPIESIVLETDAPDIAPAWLSDDQFGEQHKARNTPAEVVGVARVMAELRGVSERELADTMWRNSVAALPRLAAFADVMAPR